MFQTLIHTLQPFSQHFWDHGKKIYLVGGAVRDLFLGKDSADYDFTTDATPQEVQTFFRKVIPTGIQHGTVTVLFQGKSYEVTTFRVDGGYADHRRPNQVQFTPSLEEDLKRRDFTINAIALDLQDGTIIDYHDGQKDLNSRYLRAIGDPHQRFEEDALRILRLFRFSARLGFEIDPITLNAAEAQRFLLSALSRERVRDELNKTITAPFPERGFIFLQQLHCVELLFPGINITPLSPQDLEILSQVPPPCRWPLLFLLWGPDISIESWEAILRKLTFTNLEIKSCKEIMTVFNQISREIPSSFEVKKAINFLRSRDNEFLLKTITLLPQTRFPLSKESAELWIQLWKSVLFSQDPIFLSEMKITGNDLIDKGWSADRSLGITLGRLQELVWNDPQKNEKNQLLDKAWEWKNQL